MQPEYRGKSKSEPKKIKEISKMSFAMQGTSQPYLAFRDEENDVFIVIAGLVN